MSPSSNAGGRAGTVPSSAPTLAARRSTRRTLSSIVAGSTLPARTASTSASSHGPSGPGITRSSAARAEAVVERVANQSDITSPSNPSSRWRMSRSSELSVIASPLTAL